MTIRYATYHDQSGYAYCTPSREVYFLDTAAGSVRLTNSDIPSLILLGDVNTAEVQALLDRQRGGAAQIACTR